MRRTANAVFPAAPAPRSRRSSIRRFLLPVLMMVLATSASATVIIVDQAGGGDYLSVQEGVDAAAGGDTVRVMGGWYAERVVVDGKCLTLEGSGPAGTAVFWDGPGATLEFVNTPSPHRSYVRNINFAHSFDAVVARPAGGPAAPGSGGSVGCVRRTRDRQVHTVVWTGSTVVFDAAVINGGAIGQADVGGFNVHTGVESHQSTFDWLIVSGDAGCVVEESIVFSAAEFSGWYQDFMTMGEQSVMSSGSWYEWLGLPMLCSFASVEDSLRNVWIEGSFETSCTAEFAACGIGDAVIRNDNTVSLYDCVVNELGHHWGSYPGFRLTMEGCLVGSFSLLSDTGDARLIHNTFDGWFYYDADEPSAGSAIRSNIFMDYTTINDGGSGEPTLPVTHNLFEHDETSVAALYDSLFTNLWYEDPRFCPSERTVEDCSPCIGHAHDGGIIGAFGIGCDCTQVNAVEERSWGAIKALYR